MRMAVADTIGTFGTLPAQGGCFRLRGGRVAGPLEWHEFDRGGWPWRSPGHAFVEDGRFATDALGHPDDIVGPAVDADFLDEADVAAILLDAAAFGGAARALRAIAHGMRRRDDPAAGVRALGALMQAIGSGRIRHA